MAKKVYLGAGSEARKVHGAYVGFEEKARKVRRAYIGVGGVARPCWGAERLELYGTIPALDGPVNNVATTNGNYALFFTYSGANTAYDRNLTKTLTAQKQSFDAWGAATASIGQYMILAGGSAGGRTDAAAYDNDLTLLALPGLSSAAREPNGSSATHHAIFAGGWPNNLSAVNAYDRNLTKTTTSLATGRCFFLPGGVSSVGEYGLVMGGLVYNTGSVTTVDAFNANMSRTTFNGLSQARFQAGNACTDEYALMAGGSSVGEYGIHYGNVDVVDSNLTCRPLDQLSVNRQWCCGTAAHGQFLFTGGGNSGGQLDNVDLYDANLTHWVLDPLPTSQFGHASVTIGDYALTGGQAAETIYAYSM